MKQSVERKSCERFFNVGNYRINGFLDKIEDLVKIGMINCELGISMAQELGDIETPTTELDEIILDWVDMMEARYAKDKDTYVLYPIQVAKC